MFRFIPLFVLLGHFLTGGTEADFFIYTKLRVMKLRINTINIRMNINAMAKVKMDPGYFLSTKNSGMTQGRE